MIFRNLKILTDHYDRRYTTMLLRFFSANGDEHDAFVGGNNNLVVSTDVGTTKIADDLRGLNYAYFNLGQFQNGTLKAYIIGKYGYMPQENKPDGLT